MFLPPKDEKCENVKLINFIGKGQYGKVYTGYYKYTGNKLVVIKICNVSKKKNNNEIEILRQINYKHIVQYIDNFIYSGNEYIILEYIRGPTMFDYIQDNIISEEEALDYVKQIAKALIYLNLKNIFHGDIKAENIILSNYMDKNKTVKLIDFGHAIKYKTGECFNVFAGSLFYLSPEMVKNKKYDYRIDIWALGVLYYEMLYKLPPFYAETDEEIFELIILGQYKFPSSGSSSSFKDFSIFKDSKYYNSRLISRKTKENIQKFLQKADKRINLYNILDLTI